jgi:hypothetical protein
MMLGMIKQPDHPDGIPKDKWGSKNLFEDFESDYVDTTPTEFVMSANVNRRHLTDDQRAGIVAKLVTLAGGKPPIGGISQGVPIGELAAQANIAKRTAERAKAVDKQNPELIDEVIAGTKKLAVATKEAAAKKTDLPPNGGRLSDTPSSVFQRADKRSKAKVQEAEQRELQDKHFDDACVDLEDFDRRYIPAFVPLLNEIRAALKSFDRHLENPPVQIGPTSNSSAASRIVTPQTFSWLAMAQSSEEGPDRP